MNNLNVQPLNMDEGKTDNPPRTKRRNPSGTWTLCYCLVAGWSKDADVWSCTTR